MATASAGKDRLLFGREPAAWIAAVSVGLTLLASFGFTFTAEQTGTVLAVLTAAAALFTAWAVQPVAPALFLGLGKAVMALVLAFGLHLSADQQGAIMAAATVVLTLVLRAQVDPPVAAPVQALGMTITSPAAVAERAGLAATAVREGRHRDDDGDGRADGA